MQNFNQKPETLRDLAVLVSLSMSAYRPTGIDKAESRHLTESKGAVAGSAKVIRDRLAGTRASDILAKIVQAQGEARKAYYTRTLPWDDQGRRMASTDAAHSLFLELRNHEAKISALADEFAQAWTTAGEEARKSLNGLWDAKDYTATPDEMRAKFRVLVELEPMPRASDLRLDAPDATLAAIMKQTEDRITERFQKGCKDAHARLYKAVESIHTTLSDPKAVFRDSLVGNLRELLDILPALNIGKDAELARISAAAHDRLLKFDLPGDLATLPGAEPNNKALANTLRTDPAHRKDVAKAAGAILDDLRAYMGGAPE